MSDADVMAITIMWGAAFGGLAGLVPLFAGMAKGRVSAGVSCMVACVICGGILGLLLAGPVALISAVVIGTGEDEKR